MMIDYTQYSDNDLAGLLGLAAPIDRLEMIRLVHLDALAAEVERLTIERDALAAEVAALRAQLAGDVFVNVNGTEYRYYPGEWQPAPPQE